MRQELVEVDQVGVDAADARVGVLVRDEPPAGNEGSGRGDGAGVLLAGREEFGVVDGFGRHLGLPRGVEAIALQAHAEVQAGFF